MTVAWDVRLRESFRRSSSTLISTWPSQCRSRTVASRNFGGEWTWEYWFGRCFRLHCEYFAHRRLRPLRYTAWRIQIIHNFVPFSHVIICISARCLVVTYCVEQWAAETIQTSFKIEPPQKWFRRSWRETICGSECATAGQKFQQIYQIIDQYSLYLERSLSWKMQYTTGINNKGFYAKKYIWNLDYFAADNFCAARVEKAKLLDMRLPRKHLPNLKSGNLLIN